MSCVEGFVPKTPECESTPSVKISPCEESKRAPCALQAIAVMKSGRQSECVCGPLFGFSQTSPVSVRMKVAQEVVAEDLAEATGTVSGCVATSVSPLELLQKGKIRLDIYYETGDILRPHLHPFVFHLKLNDSP